MSVTPARYPWQMLMALAFILLPLTMGMIQVYASWHLEIKQPLFENVITGKFYGWMPLVGLMLTLMAFNQIRTYPREYKGKDLSIAILVIVYIMFISSMMWITYSRGLNGRSIIMGLILVGGLPILIKNLYKFSQKPSKYLTLSDPEIRIHSESVWIGLAVGQSFVVFQIPYLWVGKISGWLLIPAIIASIFLTIPLTGKIVRSEWSKVRPAIAWLLLTLLLAIPMGSMAVVVDKLKCFSSRPMVTSKDFEKPSPQGSSNDH